MLGYYYPTLNVVTLESVLIHLYLKSRMGVIGVPGLGMDSSYVQHHWPACLWYKPLCTFYCTDYDTIWHAFIRGNVNRMTLSQGKITVLPNSTYQKVYSRSGSNIFPWCSRVDSCRQTAFTWPTVLKPTETQKGMCQASYYRNQLGLSTVPYLSRTYTSKIGPPSGHTSPCGHIIFKMRNKYTRFLHICQL